MFFTHLQTRIGTVQQVKLEKLVEYYKTQSSKKSKREVIEEAIDLLYEKHFDIKRELEIQTKQKELIYGELLSLLAEPFTEMIKILSSLEKFNDEIHFNSKLSATYLDYLTKLLFGGTKEQPLRPKTEDEVREVINLQREVSSGVVRYVENEIYLAKQEKEDCE